MMDQKNLLLAIVLSVGIMLGFQWYVSEFGPPPEPRQEQAQNTVDPAAPPVAAEDAAPGTVPTGPDAVSVPGGTPDQAVKQAAQRAISSVPRIAIQSDRLTGTISLRGALFDDLTLLDYRETTDPTSANIKLLLPFGTHDAYFADFGWVANGVDVPNERTLWTADRQTLTPDNPVTLRWTNDAGIEFSLRLTLDENYMFSVTQRVVNSSDQHVTVFPFGRIRRSGTPDITDFYILHEGILGVFDGVLDEYDYDDLQDAAQEQRTDRQIIKRSTTGGWVGITDKYWLTALIPDQDTSATARMFENPNQQGDNYQVDFLDDASAMAPGASAGTTSRFFAGAKEARLMLKYRDDLGIERFDLAIDWGWFELLTKPIFFTLVFFTDHVVDNMGVAILLLTVLIKLAFFPLANKSYKAMSKMKALQPEMMKLRERFGDDKMRMNQEVMALYKREKANPASGCLPILPQIPVFFALYKVLFVTIEMRHADFFLWIDDLSDMDRLTFVNAFGLIDWTPPEWAIIGIWPILMGLTMYAQQKLNPPPTDPTQQKIFMFLPFIFTIMLARFPSGLVIYWAWNNLLSVLQQYVIMRRMGVPIGGGQVKPAPAAASAGAAAANEGSDEDADDGGEEPAKPSRKSKKKKKKNG